MPTLIEEGKYEIQTVGPVKTGTAKSTGKPYKTFDLQFKGDGNWYNTYWVKDVDPTVGEELEGRKEHDEKFGYGFKLKFTNNKANWNPAGANATVLTAAVAVVNGFLGLKAEHIAEWEKKRKTGQTAVDQYIETVLAIAGQLKQEVIKMGGNEVQTSEKPSSPPPASGDPGPTPPGVDTWTEESEENVDLGPM